MGKSPNFFQLYSIRYRGGGKIDILTFSMLNYRVYKIFIQDNLIQSVIFYSLARGQYYQDLIKEIL